LRSSYTTTKVAGDTNLAAPAVELATGRSSLVELRKRAVGMRATDGLRLQLQRSISAFHLDTQLPPTPPPPLLLPLLVPAASSRPW